MLSGLEMRAVINTGIKIMLLVLIKNFRNYTGLVLTAKINEIPTVKAVYTMQIFLFVHLHSVAPYMARKLIILNQSQLLILSETNHSE
jgi:hypothetical protein